MALNNPYALQFDGVNDYVQFSAKIIPPGAKSICFSLFIDSADTGYYDIIANTYSINDYGTRILIVSNELTIVINKGGSRFIQGINFSTYRGAIHNYVITWNGSTYLRVYIDNMQTPVASWNVGYTETHPGTNNMVIGKIATGNDRFLKGKLDNVSIWDRDLTEEERQSYHNRRLRGDENGLVAYYKLDEESGNIAYDSGPNGLNGTIYGASRVDGLVDLIIGQGIARLASATAHGHATGTAKPLLGNMGWALQCDGIDDYISLGTLGNFGRQRRNSIIEITFKTPPNYAPGEITYLFGEQESVSGAGAWIRLAMNADYNNQYSIGKTHFYMRDQATIGVISCEMSGTNIYDGQYHLLRIDLTGVSSSNITITVDDIPQSLKFRIKQPVGACPNFSYPLVFGARSGPNGVVSFAAITIKDIKITVNDTIFAEYPIDEGTGTTINDTSGNGYHGTIYGASWIRDALISISTISADNISASRMNIKGELLDLGDHTQAECYFQYTTDPNFNTGIIETPHQIMTTTGEFEQLVTNLDNSNTYYYRAVADYID